ncbi:MAG: flagellar biosynthetic protein FliR [Deltaproteobacteria bacterium]|jgi:flagellar biosynthetic protein FliR|nr:flagellar biosynthetic protein FliR [Deltaproteobacteria bacterium]MCH1520044.1 flagellar biosynthetic protein FliR [SAR324 cluster bacterium]MBT4015912.1 flagellar biosynthetic protein FliR [Deltaproteobacteria bacterium]MBT4184187.1 flagellar biosynthetic protein FliR [Deltaproteobacteria bacterium]MBT4630387.1 flagellar biosynthetic protein FliR [Deltaproteobacteria bacterium]|tara:strand:+ start:857 stop:1639 length:783 start_codon:yes stop_codon:yes gene_type:complete
MANLLSYDASQLLAFILVLVRVSGIIATAPVFGSSNIPPQIKVVLSLMLALILYPFIPLITVYPDRPDHYIMLIASEMLIGLVLGIIARFLFAAVEFAGTVIGFQMGLGMAMVFDPQSQEQISIVGKFENITATLIFLAMDGHLIVLQALVRSYSVLPPGGASISRPLVENLTELSASVFVIGLQIGAPLIVALFLANAIVGLLARSVPQIQVFVVGFPLTLMLGFLFLFFGMPFFAQAVHQMFEKLDTQYFEAINLLGG